MKPTQGYFLFGRQLGFAFLALMFLMFHLSLTASEPEQELSSQKKALKRTYLQALGLVEGKSFKDLEGLRIEDLTDTRTEAIRFWASLEDEKCNANRVALSLEILKYLGFPADASEIKEEVDEEENGEEQECSNQSNETDEIKQPIQFIESYQLNQSVYKKTRPSKCPTSAAACWFVGGAISLVGFIFSGAGTLASSLAICIGDVFQCPAGQSLLTDNTCVYPNGTIAFDGSNVQAYPDSYCPPTVGATVGFTVAVTTLPIVVAGIFHALWYFSQKASVAKYNHDHQFMRENDEKLMNQLIEQTDMQMLPQIIKAHLKRKEAV